MDRNFRSKYKVKVKKGQTILSVAKELGVSLQSLLNLNKGASPITTGQTLNVPKMYGGRFALPNTPPAPSVGIPTQLTTKFGVVPRINVVPPLVNKGERDTFTPGAMTPPLYSSGDKGERPAQTRAGTQTPTKAPKDSVPVDPVTGFVRGGSVPTVKVDYGTGEPVEQPTVLSVTEMAAEAGKNLMTMADFAKSTGYTKFGGTYVYIGSEVNTGQNQSTDANGEPYHGERGNRSGQTRRNKKGNLILTRGQRRAKKEQSKKTHAGEKAQQTTEGTGNASNQSVTWRV